MNYNFPDCPLKPGSHVWLYLRDSGGETQDLSSQRDYGLAYCQHHKLIIDRAFEDGAISGESIVKRDDFGLMIELAHTSKKPLVDGIIYWDTKRFARNQLDSQFYKSDLRRRGYKLISLSDNIPDGEMGILYEAFIEWKAQKDREDISKDSKRGLAYIVGMKDANGNYLSILPGRRPTFFAGVKYDTGLKRNDGRPRIVQRIVPDPELWAKGQAAWAMRAERASYDEIERELNMFPNAVSPPHIWMAIFRNEIYIGRLHYGGRTYEDFVPHLVTPETWNKVQSYSFSKPKKGQSFPAGKTHPKSGRGIYLLSGLCKCFYCQATVWGSRNTRPERGTFWRFYICSKKQARPDSCESTQVSASRLETAVIEIVNSQILTADFVDRLTDAVNAALSDTGRIAERLEQEQVRLRKLDLAISNLVDMIEVRPVPDLLDRLEARKREKEELAHKVRQLETQVKRTQITVDRRLVLGYFTDMKNKFNGDEIKARQLVLRQAVSKIEVSREKARVHCRFPLDLYCFSSMPPTENVLNTMPVYEALLR